MKLGRTITEIQTMLTDVHENSVDHVLPVNALPTMTAQIAQTAAAQASPYSVEDVLRHTEAAIAAGPQAQAKAGNLILRLDTADGLLDLNPTNHAHGQIGGYAEIPAQYYNRLKLENPGLLANNVNHGFGMAHAKAVAAGRNTGRMVRTYRGKLRALLSSRYRRLDCFDLFQAVAPALIRLGFEPISCELTDTRLYIKVVSPKITGQIGVGEAVQYGLVISGSDVGEGMVTVEPMVYKLACKNGAIMEASIKKTHVGRNEAEEANRVHYTQETRALDDLAFWNKVRDVVNGTATPEAFEQEVNKIKAAAGQAITQGNFPILVQRVANEIGGINLTETLKSSILGNLMAGAHGAGLNKWGMASAFTFAAHDVAGLDYDDSTALERAGSRIINMAEKSWGYVNRKIDRNDDRAGEKAAERQAAIERFVNA